MMKGKLKVSTAFMAAVIATMAIGTTAYMQSQAKADRATAMRHKNIACGTTPANGPDCEKIRSVLAK